MSSKTSLFLVAILCGVGVVALMPSLSSPDTDRSASRTSTVTEDTEDVAGALRPHGLRLGRGQRITYAFSTAQRSGSRYLALSGQLVLRVYREVADGWITSLELTNIRAGRRPVQGLGGEILAGLAESGRVTGLRYPASMKPRAREIVRQLVGLWQVVLPGPEDVLETVEEGRTTSYRARWEHRSNGDVVKLVNDQGFTVRARYRLDPMIRRIDGWLRAGPDELHYRFLRISTGRMNRTAPATRDSGTGAALDPAIARRRVGAILAALRNNPDSRARHRISVRLVEVLGRSPAAVDAVAARLGESALSEQDNAVIISCLGGAGNDVCQGALAALLVSPTSTPHQRRLAIFAAAQVKRPSPALERELMRLHDTGGEFASNSLLVLATIGRRVGGERRATIEQRVLDALAACGGEGQLRTALLAVANLGPVEVPSAVRHALGSGSPMVRAAAATALRRIAATEAGQLLRSVAQNDESAEVRQSAEAALRQRA